MPRPKGPEKTRVNLIILPDTYRKLQAVARANDRSMGQIIDEWARICPCHSEVAQANPETPRRKNA